MIEVKENKYVIKTKPIPLITTKKIINAIAELRKYYIMINLNNVSRSKPVLPESVIKIPVEV